MNGWQRELEKKFLADFIFVNKTLPSRVSFILFNINKGSTLWITSYLLFRVCFNISVNRFVSKLNILNVGIFIPDLTFFSAPFNNCLKCLVTLGMVTDKRKFFKIFLIHINPDVIINDTTTNSLHQSFQDENNVLSFNYTNSLFLVIGTLSF